MTRCRKREGIGELAQEQNVSSTGQIATEARWLDLHFEAEREIYEEIVNSVGIEPGWHVLDAGSGSGSFIPLLANLVGERGRITALDHARENVETLRERLEASPQVCPVEPLAGSLLDIPLPDNAVDAVWVGNVLMYFTDDELLRVLAEFNRVTRPGGLIAAKEGDQNLLTFSPLPVNLLRELRPPAPVPPLITGVFRARQNLHWFRDAGFEDVRQWTVLTERNAPLDQIYHDFIGNVLKNMAQGRMAHDPDLSNETRAWLEAQQDPSSTDALINHPQFSFCAGHVVTIGRAPQV